MTGRYQRLGALDRWFLALETPAAHMHVAGVATFRTGPLRSPSGGLDIARIRAFIESRLSRIPRYRQVIADSLLGPLWIDDARFDLTCHVRHASLPFPGTEAQLKELSSRVLSQQLDRARPLWEAWFVEGVAGGERFALISKVHHALADGISSVDLLEALLEHEPHDSFEPAAPWRPRTAPSAWELLREHLGSPARAMAALRTVGEPLADPAATASGLGDLASTVVRSPARTPLNHPIGPHRRFDWFLLDLAEVKAVRRALGGSSNDVLLAAVTGGIRRFFAQRGVDCAGLRFRVMAPVSVRKRDERGTLGNRLSAWMVPLPVGEPDPRRRLALVSETTARLKEQRSALGIEWVTHISGAVPMPLLTLATRVAIPLLPFNMVVTNVPGPRQPLYLLGTEMLDHHGMVPLTDYLGLGIVLFTYAGKVSFGFNADRDLLPDLDAFVRAVKQAFDELRALAKTAPARAPEVRA